MKYTIPADIGSLPHWARVAFAARCAENLFPAFRRVWPEARPERSTALENAVRLAKQSAVAGQPMDGLSDAIRHATMAAGAALATYYGFDSKEPVPPDKPSSQAASFAAKSAEWAAKAALEGPDSSANATLEAYTFARDAAVQAVALSVEPQMNRELTAFLRATKKGEWSDTTPVPKEMFDVVSGSKGWWWWGKA